ncbi:MAG: chromosomal replication initiator protein DnaA [Spirochaetaceae bacterium]|jgi:chromosomal replication initiator protein|nr:chromosomal replication initiator protein DnaA [Spirochaetaceae bacterium]
MLEKSQQAIWQEVQEYLNSTLSEIEYVWVSPLMCAGLSGTEINLNAPTKLHAEKTSKKYAPLIAKAVREITGQTVTVSVSCQAEAAPPESKSTGKVEKNAPGITTLKKASTASPVSQTVNVTVTAETNTTATVAAPVATTVPARFRIPKKTIGEPLHPDYTFDRYIVGDNNSFAANAAKAVSKNPGAAYNPLLIYGGVGLGKTHLMQAIGDALLDQYKVIYITAESFTNEFIQCTGAISQRNRMSAFKNKYRYVDALLIDDIHFFSNKDGSQEELFHTFNALYDANKQIIFTCDRPIAELKNIADRLKSRFKRGLNVDLKPPNYETKCAILRSKLANKTVTIPDSVIDLISNNVSTNIRDLESVLTKIVAYAELVNKSITLEIAQEQLRDLFVNTSRPASGITMEMIVRAVADHFELTPNEIKAKQKTKGILYPRQLAMHIARQITDYTFEEIGGYFGKDHSTAIYGDKAVSRRIHANPAEENVIQSLIRTVQAMSN